MEPSDGFDLPRYVTSNAHTNYMYQQPPADQHSIPPPPPPLMPPSNRQQHTRVSSIISEATPTHPSDPPASAGLQRSGSMNSSFYSPSIGGYRDEGNPSQVYNEYNQQYAPPRRANTHRDNPPAVGGPPRGTLSPKSDNRSIHSPAISTTMEAASLYPQHQQAYSSGEYGALPPIDPANHQSSPAPSSTAYSPYPNHSATNLYSSSTTDTSYAGPHSHSSHQHPQPPQDPSRTNSLHPSGSIRASASTPNTPLSYRTQPPPGGPPYYHGSQDPAQGPPPRRRPAGLRRIRDARELRPIVNPQPAGRRADPNGHGFLSPLKSLSTNLANTYNICNPQFRYETSHNPRRVLTKPSKPVHNDGFDNEDYDYILYVNDWLGAEDGQNKYLILDVLGQGTFGQVVKCQNMKTHEIVAVKVVKNKPAYFNQSMMEVTILELLNGTWDPHDEHHILRLRDTFIHKSHLCLVFELLSSNLYELIKQNQFGGLSTQLVKVFTAQLLDALTVLNEARLIHCDLKPENILLKSLQAPQIKVIDFGSACHERQTVYTYIQSRFYRSPEVLLGMAYTSAIDMWSLGCIAVELFLGLPLFPGTSEYNQITRIVEMLGLPPTYMLDIGKQTSNFFSSYLDEYGRKKYRLKSLEQYSKEHGTNEQPGKKYFSANTLPEIIRNAPVQKAGSKVGDVEREMQHRAAFIDFVQGLLNLDPIQRWSPQQAKLHPFITGEKFTKPYVPAGSNGRSSSLSSHSSQATLVGSHGHQLPPASGNLTGADPKRPFGGLVPQPAKGTRAYQDAASYNQQLAHHQAYTAQAASVQAATNAFRNPYAAAAAAASQNNAYGNTGPQQQNTGAYPLQNSQPPGSYSGAQPSSNAYATGSSGYPPVRSDSLASTSNQYAPPQPPHSQQAPHPPSNSYYPQSRARSNTINQMDQVPPSLARIANQHNLDLESAGPGGRNTLTPVINHREEAMREWERNKHAGGAQGAATSKVYQQLEYLQQQAEAGAWNYGVGGNGAHAGHSGHGHGLGYAASSHNRYAPTQPSSLQFQSPPVALVVDTHDKALTGMRDVVMSSARTAAGLNSAASTTGRYEVPSSNVPAPPQPAYVGAGSSGRYQPQSATQPPASSITYSQGQQPQSPAMQSLPVSSQPPSLYDSYDARDSMGTLYVPMQPHQYQNAYQGSPSGGSGGAPLSAQSGQATPSSATFYGSGIVPSGNALPPLQAQTKDGRRMSGMDVWSR